VTELNADMENTNDDIEKALFDLKDFIIKNDAELEEGLTFEMIIEYSAFPYVERRRLEAKNLLMNSIKYQEEFDNKMGEITSNLVTFFKDYATCLDKCREKLK
jgi:hypothetical protein